MRAVRILLWMLVACRTPATLAQGAQPDPRVPVLVELFTSEGCSDCPPAEKLLAQVDASQPFAGAHAVVLEEHVTYWDHDGWKDPFSLDLMTQRQREYQFHFGLDDIYTPQMVVDGKTQFVGSNGSALIKAMNTEAGNPKPLLNIDNARVQSGVAVLAVHGAAVPGTKLVAVVASDAAQSQVARGENAGKTLHHVAVVRTIREFNGDVVDGRPLRLEAKNLTGPVRVVVFLVDRKKGHVLAVAEETAVNGEP
jgi:hypothetical protein